MSHDDIKYIMMFIFLNYIPPILSFNTMCFMLKACQAPEPTISNLLPIDVSPTDTEEVIKLKYKVRRLEVIAENRKRRLNIMWQSRRRLRKQVERMKCIIKHLIRYKQDKQCENK